MVLEIDYSGYYGRGTKEKGDKKGPKGQNLRDLGFLRLGDHGWFLGPGPLASPEAQLQTLSCLQRRSF